MGHPRPLFRLFSVFFKQTSIQFYNKSVFIIADSSKQKMKQNSLDSVQQLIVLRMGIRGISEHHQRDIFCQLRFLCFEIWRCECKTERERDDMRVQGCSYEEEKREIKCEKVRACLRNKIERQRSVCKMDVPKKQCEII